jgi:hypothetical protein
MAKNSAERSFSSETDSRLNGQEIPRLLWNPKVHYNCRFHKSLSLDPILSQLNVLHSLAICSFKTRFDNAVIAVMCA